MLSTATATVEPGGRVAVGVKITNTGQVVDEFTVGVVGDAGPWASIEPPVVSLFPGAQGEVTVTFAPPRSAEVAAGEVPFGVRVASKEDVAGSTVEEGTLAVAAFEDVTVELVPRTSHGRRGAKASFRVDNRGNAPLLAQMAASDPDANLRFGFRPAAIDVAPGMAAIVSLQIRPASRFWSGPARSHPFQVWAQEEGRPPHAASGTFLQDPVVPGWAAKAALLLVAAAIALFVLWQAVLKPKIKSDAKNAVAQQLGTSPGANSGSASTKSGGGALTPATSPGSAGASGSGSTGSGTATGTTGSGAATTKTPIDGRLFLTASGTAAYEVPPGKQLELTDIVLENPAANTGPLTIQRSGVPLLVVDLANFRDLDYHFVSPIVFTAGKKLELVANCTSPACTPGAYFSGSLVNAP